MTTKTRRQVYLLAALVAVLVILVYVRQRDTVDAPTAPAQTGSGAAPSNQAAGAVAKNTPVTDVKLEALRREGTALTDSERNPFRFRPKAPPPAPRVVAPPPRDTFVPPPVATGPPPPPPIPLRYVGYFGAAPQLTAVLSDARGTPFYGKEGDIIEGRYRLLRIAADSVDVAYADGRGRQTLRLSSQ